jgi:hypothetical protein
MCVMIDSGGRLKQTCIEHVANIFHSLTYMYPEFELSKSNGPRINIVFTNFSK